jgi:metal-responsive CopG/Arc/MetJ family transcriptional regulator
MSSIKISITLPAKVLEQLDKLAEVSMSARSEVIRLALLEFFQSTDSKRAQHLQMLHDTVSKQRLDRYLDTIDWEEVENDY